MEQRLYAKYHHLIASCVSRGVFTSMVYDLTEEEAFESHDAQIYQLAQVVAQFQNDSISPGYVEEDHVLGDYFVVIRGAGGEKIYSSDDKLVLPKTLRLGVQEIKVHDETWLVWSFPGEKTAQTYIVGIIIHQANELAEQTVVTVSIPLALVLVFSIVATIFIVKRGLKPLTNLSQTLASQDPERLGKVSSDKQPDELEPIVTSLNTLFDRIEEYIAREQRFIDDAAHEIRTPLTVVKAQCQVIERDKLDDATRMRFDNIIQGIDRATHLAAKLLEHARASQDQGKDLEPHDLSGVLQESLAQQVHAAHEKNVELQLLQSEPAEAITDLEDLSAILSNLIGNAIRHTPKDDQVIVVVSNHEEHVCLSVEDSGSGVPDDFKDKVFDRFFRMPGQTGSGAGLGLSITQTLCRRNNIEITLHESERLGGACFQLKLKR